MAGAETRRYVQRSGTIDASDGRMPISIPHAQPGPRSESAPGEPRASESAGRTAKLLLLAALCLLLGYAGGLMHGTLRARPAEQRLASELADSVRKLESSQKQVAIERSARTQLKALTDLYEAYRASVQALSALDARNFGIAESRLRASEATLRQLTHAGPGVKALHSAVAQMNVTVADDLAVQRSAIVELVAKLDAQLRVSRGDLMLTSSSSAAELRRE